MSVLFVVHDFASAGDCARLVAAFDEVAARGHGHRYPNRIEIPAVLASSEPLVQQMRERMVEFLHRHFDKTLEPEYLVFSCMLPGDSHVLHADAVRREGDAWVPNHTPNRRATALLYLNDEFGGGTLRHPRLAHELDPRTGTLAAFPCTGEFEHSVDTITSGRRLSLALWTT